MSNITLKNISLTVFGESHGECVGAVLTGFPAGHKVDFDALYADMQRRRPGRDRLSTQRAEDDEFSFISGIFEGITTGAPICVVIKNTSNHSADYNNIKDVPRPSHADYPAYVKYNGYNDIRGGGHFSGRLTAPIVCLGSLCKQYLHTKNISINAFVSNVGGIENTSKSGVCEEVEQLILKQAKLGDSVGGQVACAVKGMPAGIGGPLYEGVEGLLSRLLFGIPAVKAVEFGLGTAFANSFGGTVNDEYKFVDGKIQTITNNNGGITGGITNGSDIDVKVTFKPTPSIYKEQNSIDLKQKKNCLLKIEGRHDPCIVLRAVPVVECTTAIGILDMVI